MEERKCSIVWWYGSGYVFIEQQAPHATKCVS